jgi:hypothetical protein
MATVQSRFLHVLAPWSRLNARHPWSHNDIYAPWSDFRPVAYERLVHAPHSMSVVAPAI